MADKTLELALRIVAQATGKQSIEALIEELRRIGEASDTANPKAQALTEGIDEAGNAANQSAEQVDALQQSLSPLGNELEKVGEKAKDTSTEANTLANKLDDLANQQDLINAFKRSRNELEQQELALTATALGLQDLKQRAQATDAPFVDMARAIDTAEKELEQMQRELAKQSASHTQLQNALSKSGIDYNNLTTAQRKLSSEFDGTGRNVDKFANQLDKGNASARDHASSLRGVITQVTALASAYLGFDRVAQAVKDIFATGDQFERLGVQMNAVMGSFASGRDATAWVKQFAIDVPLQLNEVNQAFVKAKAFGLDPMNGTMKAIVDQAFKLGGGFQEVEGITLALGQAWAKQKLQGEEILQLIERGVPVWDMLAKVTGKNTTELQKLSEQGKLGREAIQGLIDEMGRASSGSAAAQMALLSGQVSNLKDNLSNFYDLIAQSGALEWLKAQISELNQEFAAAASDGRLQQWAQQISDTIITAGAAIQDSLGLLYDYRAEIGFVAKAWLALKVGSYFGDVVQGAQAAIGVMRLYTAAIAGTTAASETAAVAAGKLKTALAAAAKAGLYLALINEIGNVVLAYQDLKTAQEAQEEAERRAAQSTKEKTAQLKDLSEQTGIAFETMAEFNKAEADGLVIYDQVTGKWKAAAAAMKEVTQAAEQVAEPVRLNIAQALKLTLTLNEQIDSLDNLQGGMGGFIRQIDAALEPLKAAGEEYAAHVTLLEELRAKFAEQQTYLDAVAQGTAALEQAYKDLGLTSGTALEQTAEKSKAAFELIRDAKQPVDQIRDAFINYARAAIVAAEAQGKAVPETLKQQAAALQLSNEYDKLIQKQNGYKDGVDGLTPSHKRLATEVQATKDEIEKCNKVMDSSTASADEKATAHQRLGDLTTQLTAQTKALNDVQALEVANYAELKGKYAAVSDELLHLDKAYKDGAFTAEEYLRQKERLIQVLNALRDLMGGLPDAEKATANAVKNTTKTLAEQRDELAALERATGRATEYVNKFAGAYEHLNKQFKFNDDSTEKLNARVDELTKSIMTNMRVNTGFWGVLAQLSNQAFIRERQMINETLLTRKWTEQLESSSITLQQINAISRSAQYNVRLLGDEELKPLQAAIDNARQKILSMRDDLSSTLSSLRDEMDQLNDNQAAIEKRHYEQQKVELQAKLDAARAAQDQESIKSAQEALRLSEQIYATKVKQIKAEAEERAAQTTANAASQAVNINTNSNVAVSSTSTVNTVHTVRLELVFPSGTTIEASAYNSSAEALLAEMERIKGSS